MVQEQSVPWLEKSDGMLGYFPGEPFDEDAREFVMITLWRDLDALKAFAGTDWNNPVVTRRRGHRYPGFVMHRVVE